MTELIQPYESDRDWESVDLSEIERAKVEKAIVGEETLAEFLAEYGCHSAAKGIIAWADWLEEKGQDPNSLELDR